MLNFPKTDADEAMNAAPRASSNMHGVCCNKRGKNWRAHARLDGESLDKEEDMDDMDDVDYEDDKAAGAPATVNGERAADVDLATIGETVSSHELSVGLAVVVPFDDGWYRGKVVYVSRRGDTARVSFEDGEEYEVRRACLRKGKADRH